MKLLLFMYVLASGGLNDKFAEFHKQIFINQGGIYMNSRYMIISHI